MFFNRPISPFPPSWWKGYSLWLPWLLNNSTRLSYLTWWFSLHRLFFNFGFNHCLQEMLLVPCIGSNSMSNDFFCLSSNFFCPIFFQPLEAKKFPIKETIEAISNEVKSRSEKMILVFGKEWPLWVNCYRCKPLCDRWQHLETFYCPFLCRGLSSWRSNSAGFGTRATDMKHFVPPVGGGSSWVV